MKLIVTMSCGHQQAFKSGRLAAIKSASSLNCRKCGCSRPVSNREVRV